MKFNNLCLILLAIIVSSIIQAQSGTFLLKNVNQVTVAAPSVNPQKKTVSGDQKIMEQVKYWDAGVPAYRWNEIAYKITNFENFNTFLRAPSAWMNIAINDATLVAIEAKKKYARKGPDYPCLHSVTAATAASVLAYFFPEKADSLMKLAREASSSRVAAGLQYPEDAEAGWKLGEEVAAFVIEQAKNDGSSKQWDGNMNKDPKHWTGDYPVGITTGSFKPLVLKSGSQFRPPAPPDFAKDMQELKQFKPDFYATHQALYWAMLTGYDFWTEMASLKMFENRMNDPIACNQIYMLLHVAIHDASIAIMDAKYAYWGIRPFQYEPGYKPLIFTPPFPGYPSGHATASSTAATVLAYFFPADRELFERKAWECAESRFYGGIHFRTDNEVGIQLGKKLGQYVVETKGKRL